MPDDSQVGRKGRSTSPSPGAEGPSGAPFDGRRDCTGLRTFQHTISIGAKPYESCVMTLQGWCSIPSTNSETRGHHAKEHATRSKPACAVTTHPRTGAGSGSKTISSDVPLDTSTALRASGSPAVPRADLSKRSGGTAHNAPLGELVE